MQDTAELASTRVMRWLAEGLPLSLLVDLFVADRLDSGELMRREAVGSGARSYPHWPHPAA